MQGIVRLTLMDAFDVIVVGAGPAGSTAAYRLARQGARVALLDRATFPRDKPCGGGITVRGLEHLPVDVTPVVEDRITSLELRFGDDRSLDKRCSSPVVLMTQRRRLDEYLAHQAAAAGADMRDGVRVRTVDQDDHGVTVRTDQGALRAQMVIGADGCNGVSAKALGLGAGIAYGIAYEGNVPWESVGDGAWRSRLLLEFSTVPGGYAWLFPKADHVNVGVGGWANEASQMRGHLARLCDRLGIDQTAVAAARGYRLPLRDPRAPVANARAVIVGDAAGLVDPMSGDGMFEAFLSSRIAAETISGVLQGTLPDLRTYERRLNGALARHRMVSWIGKRVFDQFPGAARRLAASDAVWSRVEARVRGDRPHRPRSAGSARAEAIGRAFALGTHSLRRG
jgi:geranylgeranyl reductase family protein